MLEKITVRVRKKVIGLMEIKGLLFSSRTYVEELERFRKIPSVKAVLIRIDSPGGAVVPSQEIFEAILRVRETKPVRASLGSVAASGGYYIASAAEKIYASPGTLTGSIGVAMHMRNVQELFAKLGIDNSIIKSGKFKDVGSPYRKMTPQEHKVLQGVSDEIYEQFVDAVARGRRIKREEAEKLADGRIYTGKTARELGMVDELGGLQVAIRETGRDVGIPEEPIVVSFKRKRHVFREHLVQSFVRHLLLNETPRAHALQGVLLLAPGMEL